MQQKIAQIYKLKKDKDTTFESEGDKY